MSSIVSFAGYVCALDFTARYLDRHIVIRLLDQEGFPVAIATVNLGGLAMDEVAIKDYSENAGMLALLLKADVIYPPHRFLQSGYVSFPICYLKPVAVQKAI